MWERFPKHFAEWAPYGEATKAPKVATIEWFLRHEGDRDEPVVENLRKSGIPNSLWRFTEDRHLCG